MKPKSTNSKEKVVLNSSLTGKRKAEIDRAVDTAVREIEEAMEESEEEILQKYYQDHPNEKRI